ncbi:MAG: aminodeoxychorismate/anthranilate synthase component II, partial [Deltaproteobacteria bacterium]|nr:aminodeoxychorismate/anthranilate synthase component II [Deltaproteobacteria bacterium]
IIHSGDSFYAGLPNPFSAGRYHSLYVDSVSLPDCLEVTAKTDSGLIMGLRHKKLPVASVQFHPESILTLKDQSGLRMINKMMAELTSGTNNKEGS